MLFVLGTTEIFTPVVEGAATAIGAGLVIGGFLGASRGILQGRSRKEVEGNALRDTYFGAAWALGLWTFDQCIVYAA
jgi:hypothetical protein